MMKNDERYTKYSAFSFWEKKTYYNQIYVFLKWLNLEYPGFNTWYDNLFTENKELKSGREIIICEKEQKKEAVEENKDLEENVKLLEKVENDKNEDSTRKIVERPSIQGKGGVLTL